MICLACMSRSCEHASPSPRNVPPHLTPGEVEILRLVAEGHANKEIGARLGKSEGTIKVRLVPIYRALQAGNRVQAARWAWEHSELLDSGQESEASLKQGGVSTTS